MAITLIHEFSCDISDCSGNTLLHSACQGGCLSLVRTLIQDHNADVNAQNQLDKDTPLHLAVRFYNEEVVLALINEFGCDINARNSKGDNCLHTACSRYRRSSLVKVLSKHISPLTVNNKGNTPLHIASDSYFGSDYVKELLSLDAPIMLRNAAGKTARDVACDEVKPLLDAYITANRDKIYTHYDKILHHAKKIYSKAERIARIFVLEQVRAPLWRQLKGRASLNHFIRCLNHLSLPTLLV